MNSHLERIHRNGRKIQKIFQSWPNSSLTSQRITSKEKSRNIFEINPKSEEVQKIEKRKQGSYEISMKKSNTKIID